MRRESMMQNKGIWQTMLKLDFQQVGKQNLSQRNRLREKRKKTTVVGIENVAKTMKAWEILQ